MINYPSYYALYTSCIIPRHENQNGSGPIRSNSYKRSISMNFNLNVVYDHTATGSKQARTGTHRSEHFWVLRTEFTR